eukprot:scaffold139844_cov21-Tisochrysis_lutea.AAC.1
MQDELASMPADAHCRGSCRAAAAEQRMSSCTQFQARGTTPPAQEQASRHRQGIQESRGMARNQEAKQAAPELDTPPM